MRWHDEREEIKNFYKNAYNINKDEYFDRKNELLLNRDNSESEQENILDSILGLESNKVDGEEKEKNA